MRPTTASQREVLTAAAWRYREALTPDVLEYLEARGLNRQAVDTSLLGVVSNPEPGHPQWGTWLSIPYQRHDGQVVGMRFRCLTSGCEHEHHGKYMSVKGAPVRTYGISCIHDAEDVIHVCEGELDSLVLRQAGMMAIAIPGVDAWMPRHKHMLAGFSKVYVWADPDEAGLDLVNRVTRSLRQATPIRLTHGDVTETYLAGVDLWDLIS